MYLWSCQEILNILREMAKQLKLHFVKNSSENNTVVDRHMLVESIHVLAHKCRSKQHICMQLKRV